MNVVPIGGPTEAERMSLPFEERTVTIKGQKFRFRELSVEENDRAADSAKNPDGTVNGRTMMRLMILASLIEPKLSAQELAKLPQRAYIRIYDAVADLNTVELGDDPEEEGKS
jgi:hypothetical protein